MARTRLELTEGAWTVLILVGGVLIFTLVSIARVTTSGKTEGSVVPQLSAGAIPIATGDEPLMVLFTQAGCPVCHAIPGITGAEGKVGPRLTLGTNGPRRLADPQYKGRATTVREYIVESVLEPGAYTVPGYPPLAMPRWYGQKLSALALDRMAAYLEQLREEQ